MSQDVMNCPACGRRTPSARGTCLYCGAALPVTKIEAAPPQRNIDSFEPAFNTVLEPSRARAYEQTAAALASALKIELTEAGALITASQPLPLARSQNRQEAGLIASLVRTCGLSARVVPDQDLELEYDLARARRITPGEAELEVHHSGGVMMVALAEIKLLVVGTLRNTRVEYTEGISGMRGQTGNVLDTAEFSSDETLLDVYTNDLRRSFRVKSDAFDYSGLVRPLSFRAEVNFKQALTALRAAMPQAIFDDDFARIRGLLSRAWPERSRVESRGVRRAGLSHRPVAQSRVTSDNRDQFNRYSRLMFLFANDQ